MAPRGEALTNSWGYCRSKAAPPVSRLSGHGLRAHVKGWLVPSDGTKYSEPVPILVGRNP